jgi:hypothetical protein
MDGIIDNDRMLASSPPTAEPEQSEAIFKKSWDWINQINPDNPEYIRTKTGKVFFFIDQYYCTGPVSMNCRNCRPGIFRYFFHAHFEQLCLFFSATFRTLTIGSSQRSSLN